MSEEPIYRLLFLRARFWADTRRRLAAFRFAAAAAPLGPAPLRTTPPRRVRALEPVAVRRLVPCGARRRDFRARGVESALTRGFVVPKPAGAVGPLGRVLGRRLFFVVFFAFVFFFALEASSTALGPLLCAFWAAVFALWVVPVAFGLFFLIGFLCDCDGFPAARAPLSNFS